MDENPCQIAGPLEILILIQLYQRIFIVVNLFYNSVDLITTSQACFLTAT